MIANIFTDRNTFGWSGPGSKRLRAIRSTDRKAFGSFGPRPGDLRVDRSGSRCLRADRSTDRSAFGRFAPRPRDLRVDRSGSRCLRADRSTIETPSGGLIGETSGARTRVQALGVSLFLGAIYYWMACAGHRRQKGKWPGAKLVQHQRPHRAMTSGLDYPHPARSVPREAVGFVSTKYCVLLY